MFLDSHIEVIYGWLEALIHPIIDNNRLITCPIIDAIDPDTFEYIVVKNKVDGYLLIWIFPFKLFEVTNYQFNHVNKNITLFTIHIQNSFQCMTSNILCYRISFNTCRGFYSFNKICGKTSSSKVIKYITNKVRL